MGFPYAFRILKTFVPVMLKNSSSGYVCCTVGFFYWYCARYASNFSELADICNANIFIKVLNSPTEVIAFDRVEYCIICKQIAVQV